MLVALHRLHARCLVGTGKGGRLVMLCAITKEFGMLGNISRENAEEALDVKKHFANLRDLVYAVRRFREFS